MLTVCSGVQIGLGRSHTQCGFILWNSALGPRIHRKKDKEVKVKRRVKLEAGFSQRRHSFERGQKSDGPVRVLVPVPVLTPFSTFGRTSGPFLLVH